MPIKKIPIVVLTLAGLSITAIYFAYRNFHTAAPAVAPTSQNQPPQGVAHTRPIDHRSALLATEPPGPHQTTATNTVADKQAAMRQFHEAEQCRSLSQAVAGYQSQIRACQNAAAYPQTRDTCAKNITDADAKTQILLPRLDGCNADPQVLEENYYQAMTQAARLGDTDAQLCWVEGSWHHALPEEEYQAEALDYLNKALARGDWRFVKLMATHYVDNPPRSAGLLVYAEKPADRQLNMSDFEAAPYRMSQLLRLGATGRYVQWIDMLSSATFMSQEQIDAANEWAEQEYREHFANLPKLSEIPESCDTGIFDGDHEQARHPWRPAGESAGK